MTARHRRTAVKDILWILTTVGLVAAIFRFARGLGAATALNDAAPWGLWIAFKLAFVALAGGGFTIAALVYIFQLETYRPIVRPAIMIALLGYGSFIVSLLFDLGLPWRIYMPIIHWQHHSVMFEIAWCVMLYFTVLNLEFGPVILEHRWFQHPIFQWISQALHRLTVPIVIAGIVLSTLHQSSLGSLFLIMPFRVHPLWYSPLIPLFFFISAIGLGLMALILDEFIGTWIIGRKPHTTLLPRLAKIASVVLWFYLALRLGDLVVRGTIPAALDGSWQSWLFGAEILIGGLLPAALLLVPKVRNSSEGLITCAILTVFGIVSQRFSLSMLTMQLPEGTSYIPSMLEIAIALAVPAAASLLYFLFAEHLGVVQEELPQPPSPYARPDFDPDSRIYTGTSLWATVARRSFTLIVVASLTVAFLPTDRPQQSAVPVAAARGWDLLVINGNRDERQVDFDHVAHQEQISVTTANSENVCRTCHHLSKPNDEASACWECHQDMHKPTSIFDHTLHQHELGGNASCVECHQGAHTAQTARPCVECHDTMVPDDQAETFYSLAPGYKEAMHGACIPCHHQEAELQARPDLERCPACHQLGDNRRDDPVVLKSAQAQ